VTTQDIWLTTTDSTSTDFTSHLDPLQQAWNEAWLLLRRTADGPAFSQLLVSVYGTTGRGFEAFAAAESLRQRILAGDRLGLKVRVVDAASMNGVSAVYAAGTVYVNGALLGGTSSPSLLQPVLLEEIGHAIEKELNPTGGTDTTGDEGELFSALVRGIQLSDADKARIATENDIATITVDGQVVVGEASAAVGTSYTGGTSGYEIKSDQNWGQTFRLGSVSGATTALINSLSLNLYRLGDASSQTITVTIRSSWNGAVLWAGAVVTANIGTNSDNMETFAPNISLNLDTTYLIRVTSSHADGKIFWRGSSGDSYGGGSQFKNDGSTDAKDLNFSVSGNAVVFAAPTATVAAATIPNTSSITVQSTETGTAYLVNSMVAISGPASITGAADNLWNSVAITTANSNTSLAATGLINGIYKLYAVDAEGNLSNASTESVTIHSNAPTAILTAATVPNTSSITVQSTEIGTAYLVKSTVAVTGPASITGAADNLWNSVVITTANSNTSLAAAGLTDGTYKLYAIDSEGNLSSASTASVIIDSSAPTATLTAATVPNTSSITVQSTETGTAYLVNSTVAVSGSASITGAADNLWNSVGITTANSNTSLAATGLIDGTYTLYTADAAGNLSSATTALVTIDFNAPTAPLPFLQVSGTRIVNRANNQEVILNAVNMGNWMVMEGYMMNSVNQAPDQHTWKQKLSALVGPESVKNFFDSWLTNHVTQNDINQVKAWGFNAVRLPLHYEYFVNLGTPDAWNEQGFSLLDNIISWCASAGIYAILDLHAAPGGQSDNSGISDYDSTKPSLWESAENRSKTVRLWDRISERYKSEPWVAGYDLINEPNWNLPNGTLLRELYGDLTQTIRANGDQHILFIEGNNYSNNYTGLTPAWDPQMVYVFHKYGSSADFASDLQWVLDLRAAQNRPIWCGEHGENSNDNFTKMVELLRTQGIGMSWWPMKKFESINCLASATFPPGYNDLLNYLGGSNPNLSADAARITLAQLADSVRLANTELQDEVLRAIFNQPGNRETAPFGNIPNLPGIIYASDYDQGMNGYAYSDTGWENVLYTTGDYTAWNERWTYRNGGVDIEACSDPVSNGFNVCFFNPTEWMKYTVEVPSTGTYSIDLRVANGSGQTATLEIQNADGTKTLAKASVPSGGWYDWVTVTVTGGFATSGIQAIRIANTGGSDCNINSVRFTKIADAVPGTSSVPVALKTVSLKANNGGYLCWEASNSSVLTCSAVSETANTRFTLIDAGNGRTALLASNGRYVRYSSADNKLYADSTNVGPNEEFLLNRLNRSVAIQAANSLYVSQNANEAVRSDRSILAGWEYFVVTTLATTQGPPATPLGVTLLDGTITWKSMAGATHYTVERRTSTGGSFQTVATGISDTSFTDSSLGNGALVSYRVISHAGTYISAPSVEVGSLPPDLILPQITGITVAENQVLLQFSEAMQTTDLTTTPFVVRVAGSIRSLSAWDASPTDPTKIILTLSGTAPSAGQSVTVAYTDPAGNNATGVLQDLAGNDLASTPTSGLAADTLRSTVNVTSLASSYTNLVLSGTAVVGTGNTAANQITVEQSTAVANVITGAAGVDVMDGGNGGDIYVITSSAHHTAAEIFDSGILGTDELRFSSSSSGQTLMVYGGNLGVERVAIGTGTGASAVSTATTALSVNASSAANALTITGNNGANRLFGSAYGDVINANGGNDTLVGGVGADTLTGGAGADVFRFEKPIVGAIVDVITDFTPAQSDLIQLENSVFTALPTTGALSTAAFGIGASAVTAAQRIGYDSTSGSLWYDADGSGSLAASHFARLSMGLVLTASRFVVS
jgi:Ca2+-binding RTX toxin-like protein